MAEDPNEVPSSDPIGSRDDLQNWLRARSGDTVGEETKALLLRIAMRLFPLVLQGLELDGPEQEAKYEKRLILQSFRALLTTRAVLTHSASNLTSALNDVQRAIKNIKFIDQDGVSTVAAQLAADAASCASYRPGKSGTAKQYKDQFLRAAGSAINRMMQTVSNIDGAENDLFQSITEDVRVLQDGSTADELLKQRLWLNDVRSHKPKRQNHNLPDWCRTPFDRFQRNRYVKDQPWEKVVEWYRSFLAFDKEYLRDGFGATVELGIAQLPDDAWDSDPDEVMEKIAGIIERPTENIVNLGVATETDEALPLEQSEQNQSERSGLDESEPAVIDSTRLHGDQPTADDKLGRQVFARGLVETIYQVLVDQHAWLAEERAKLAAEGRLELLDGDGFAVHLHAPWGAGKTSVLKMMEARMTSRRRSLSERWIVVNFNAWRHERRNPPWRPLIEAVYRDCIKGLNEFGHFSRRIELGNYWNLENIHAQYGPYVYAALVLCGVFIFASAALDLPGIQSIIGSEAVKNIVSFVASILSAFGVFVLFGQRIVFGSRKDAETHAAHAHDPLKRHKLVFQKLIRHSNARICIFIDDLDRCNADYVVDLLEGVQTAFRHENVVYVVAADKSWIRTAFETRYKPFDRQSEIVGQSLGFLFLDKIFQISTSVPGMGEQVRKDYLGMLVDSPFELGEETGPAMPEQDDATDESASSVEEFDAQVDEKRKSLREFSAGGVTRESADRWLSLNQTAADRAAAGLEMVFSPEAKTNFEHRLKRFEHLLPDNPRVIKRLVNAYGFRNLIGYSENNNIDPDILARWTILEQRFSETANLLTEHPEWVDQIYKATPPVTDDATPQQLRAFINSATIRGVIGDSKDRLTTANVRILTRGLRA